eukprot:m.23893 g.23893  ORF g.23893 m.23893 type:complete len:595 (-) comp4113_c0_seq1:25-1809(-)
MPARHMSILLCMAVCVGAVLLTSPAPARAGPSLSMMEVGIKAVLRPRGRQALEKTFWDVANPDSSEYLQFKSIPELALLVGAEDGDVDAASAWLASLPTLVPGSISVAPLRDHVTARVHVPTPVESHATLADVVQPYIHPSRPKAIAFLVHNTAAETDPSTALKRNVRGTHPSLQQQRAQLQFGYSVAEQKAAYGIPVDLATTNGSTMQMVWGPGTFGYSKVQLEAFKMSQCPKLNMDKVVFDTANHGTPGGDNYGEGNLDVSMIASFGLNALTVVSNTNTSSSTEEGDGFGAALLDFVLDLPNRKTLPQVLSISLGSLSAASCKLLCTEAVKQGFTAAECHSFMQEQRQVCMYLSEAQVDKISTALMTLGLRGVSVFGSSGDGGSHWSFEPFPSDSAIGRALNKIGCEFQFPVFPTGSPYVTSVGGTTWKNGNAAEPQAWDGSGGGFAWQFPRPAHQDAAVSAYLAAAGNGLPPASSYNASNRAYPDVSSVSVEGTSESSPTVAGIFTLLMDQRLNAGLPPLGFLGPRLYKAMATDPTGSDAPFESVTEGNTKTSCSNGFPAASGWDPVTGWGRPRWAGLVKHFASDDTLVVV